MRMKIGRSILTLLLTWPLSATGLERYAFPPADVDRFLVPVATGGVIGAGGHIWRSAVTIFNYGDEVLQLNEDVGPFESCFPGPTPTELPPLTALTLCGLDLGFPEPPTMFMNVRKGARVALASELIGPHSSRPPVPVPVVPLTEFRKELIFPKVLKTDDPRLALRLYHAEPHPVAVAISYVRFGMIDARETVIVGSTLPVPKPGYAFIPLDDAPSTVLKIRSEYPIWAMITSTHNVTQEVLLSEPSRIP
jgi:hypothetical protein